MANSFGGYFIAGWQQAQEEARKRREHSRQVYEKFLADNPYSTEEDIREFTSRLVSAEPHAVAVVPMDNASIQRIAEQHDQQRQLRDALFEHKMGVDRTKAIKTMLDTAQKGAQLLAPKDVSLVESIVPDLPDNIRKPIVQQLTQARLRQERAETHKALMRQYEEPAAQADASEDAERALSRMDDIARSLSVRGQIDINEVKQKAFEAGIPEQLVDMYSPARLYEVQRQIAAEEFDRANRAVENLQFDTFGNVINMGLVDDMVATIADERQRNLVQRQINDAALRKGADIRARAQAEFSNKLLEHPTIQSMIQSEAVLSHQTSPEVIESTVRQVVQRMIPESEQAAFRDELVQASMPLIMRQIHGVQAKGSVADQRRDREFAQQQAAAQRRALENAPVNTQRLHELGFDVQNPMVQDFLDEMRKANTDLSKVGREDILQMWDARHKDVPPPAPKEIEVPPSSFGTVGVAPAYDALEQDVQTIDGLIGHVDTAVQAGIDKARMAKDTMALNAIAREALMQLMPRYEALKARRDLIANELSSPSVEGDRATILPQYDEKLNELLQKIKYLQQFLTPGQ